VGRVLQLPRRRGRVGAQRLGRRLRGPAGRIPDGHRVCCARRRRLRRGPARAAPRAARGLRGPVRRPRP
jgi:hypothetical protein